MSLTFDEASHTYKWDGKVVPGVTTIIRSLSDYSGIPDAVMEKARQEGTAIHRVVEWHEDGTLDEPGLPEWLRPFLAAWRKFKADTGWETDSSEKRLFNRTFGYAGTCDLIGTAAKLPKLKGRGIVDLKRSLYDDPATGVQLSAYAMAESIMQIEARTKNAKDMQIKWRAGLKLNKDGTYRFQTFHDNGDWATFLACLTVYRWLQEHRA